MRIQRFRDDAFVVHRDAPDALDLVGALLLGRGLEAHLFRVSPADPWAYGVTGAVVMMVAVLASLIPAVRASRVAPVEALREEP